MSELLTNRHGEFIIKRRKNGTFYKGKWIKIVLEDFEEFDKHFGR